MACPFVLFCIVLMAAPSAFGQQAHDTNLRGQSEQTYKRLAEAERKLIDGKAAEASDAIQRILDEAGDDLVSPDGVRYRPARQMAQMILAKFPAERLQALRDRVDEPARKLLEAGKKNRDSRPLRELVDRYFVSASTEEALWLLGEYAFERGEFRSAESYWRRLLPNADPMVDPSYPDSKTPIQNVQARVILAIAFLGDPERAKRELELFRKSFPQATGRIAGREGILADTLQSLISRPIVFESESHGDEGWKTLSGSANRNGRAPERLPYFWPGRPTWKAVIPSDRAEPQRVYPRIASSRAVAFHPVVLDGIAYIADSSRVMGYDVRTGQLQFSYDLRTEPIAARMTSAATPIPIPYDADFALTTANNRLYARLGNPLMAPPPVDPIAGGSVLSYLVGFERPQNDKPRQPALEPKWTLSPPEFAGSIATWEGAPVWYRGRLFAALTRFDGNRTIHSVACYEDPPGKPVWLTDVCDSPSASENRYRHELLSLCGDRLVFCSNTGVVSALDSRTGKAAWAFRYPRATRTSAANLNRDYSPPLAENGRIFVAPSDSDHVYALDAETGWPLWGSQDLAGKPVWGIGPLVVDQMLGISRGRLICTIASPIRGIRAFNVQNGSDRAPDGWAVHDDPLLMSFGRGLVSEEMIVWPTKSGLFLLNPSDGMPLRPPVSGPHGNLAFAEGVLIVTTPTEVWGYVSDRAEFPERKAAASHSPSPELARKLAYSLADAGAWAQAERVLRNAEPAVEPERVRAQWLADRADRAWLTGQHEDAKALLIEGLAPEFPTSWRNRAAARLLTLEASSGKEFSTQKVLASLKQPAGFELGTTFGGSGLPIRITEWNERQQPPPINPKSNHRLSPLEPNSPTLLLHQLDSKLDVQREITFPTIHFQPLLPIPGESRFAPQSTGMITKFAVSNGRELLLFSGETEKPDWQTSVPHGLSLTHAAVIGDALLGVGPNGAASFQLSDGKVNWSFPFPDLETFTSTVPQPTPRATGLEQAHPGLSDFHLAGTILVARLGQHHLLAMDVNTGRFTWVLDTFGRNRFLQHAYPNSPRFLPAYYADERCILIQLSNSKRWTIDVQSGKVLQISTTAIVDWETPPVRISADQVIVSDGPGLISCISSVTNRGQWVSESGGETSLSGRPPQIRSIPNGLIIAISRNHGTELILRSAANGASLWRDPVLLPAGHVDLAASDVDASHFYAVAEGKIYALRLKDGQITWSTNLEIPSGEELPRRWQLRSGRNAIVAHPCIAMTESPFEDILKRATSRFAMFPDASRLPTLGLGLYDAWTARTLPIFCIDPISGQIQNRLNLNATGPNCRVYWSAEHAVVMTAGKAYWLK